MAMNAYQSDPSIRDAGLARLRSHAAANRLVQGPLSWNGEKGSLVGCVLESDDATQWETRLGLPQWLATVADGMAAQRQSPEHALQFGVDVLSAIRPGADLSLVGSAVILSALGDMKHVVTRSVGLPETLAHVQAQVEALHRQLLAGEAPMPAAWRSARRAATKVTDAQSSGQLKGLASCIETAAWDPASSHAVVFDTLRVHGQASFARFLAEGGWREEDGNRIQDRLRDLWERHLANRPDLQDQGVTVFSLLEEHHPDEAALIRKKSRMDIDAMRTARERATALLLEPLRAA